MPEAEMGPILIDAEQVLETWRINGRIGLYVLEAIAPEALSGALIPKGRRVGDIFAHMHMVRLLWLKASAPDLLGELVKVEKERATDKDLLRESLEASGAAMEGLLRRGLDTGRIKNFKPHPTAFLAYLAAHEGYHLGEIGILLAQSGHPLDKKVSYGMWEWGTR